MLAVNYSWEPSGIPSGIVKGRPDELVQWLWPNKSQNIIETVMSCQMDELDTNMKHI